MKRTWGFIQQILWLTQITNTNTGLGPCHDGTGSSCVLRHITNVTVLGCQPGTHYTPLPPTEWPAGMLRLLIKFDRLATGVTFNLQGFPRQHHTSAYCMSLRAQVFPLDLIVPSGGVFMTSVALSSIRVGFSHWTLAGCLVSLIPYCPFRCSLQVPIGVVIMMLHQVIVCLFNHIISKTCICI